MKEKQNNDSCTKSKLENALEKIDTDTPENDICFQMSIFYNKHLMGIIDLDGKHDFLSALEKEYLKKLAMIMEERIMEDISVHRTCGLNNYRSSSLS